MVERGIQILLYMAVLMLPVMHTQAEVIASIDRADIEINESFTLKVTTDIDLESKPDVSGLKTDFYVSQGNQLSSTTIINGQISRSNTWSYVLMPRRTGDLVIPAVIIGNEQSAPLYITVAPQLKGMPGEADIFVSAEVDDADSYVQAQILYTVKVYRSVSTRQPRLSEPNVRGVEVLVEQVGEERSYESIMSGKHYNVVERVYALFPQESGKLSITPARFEARILRDGRITGRKIFESESLMVTVNPIPPSPPEFQDAAWLPAKSLKLSETWSREPDKLPAGEPITRHVTITALGLLSTQIPVIDLIVSDGVKIYPDKPEFRVIAKPNGMQAMRKEQYALIGVRAGVVELPELKLPWWNIEQDEWHVASLPSRTLTILPSGETELPLVVEQKVEASLEGETIMLQSNFWRHVSEGVIALWLLTMFSWWWSRRPEKKSKERESPSIHRQQAKVLKTVRRAALSNDSTTVKSALLNWGRLQWPNDWPRNIGDFASRVSDPLAGELMILCNASYGPVGDVWDGKSLAKALRSFTVKSSEEKKLDADELPPLMPRPPA